MARPDRERLTVIILPFFSLLLGYIVWVINKHLETDIRTIPVAVVPINQPAYIDVQSFEPDRVLVSFNLRKADEFLIGQSDDFQVTVDLSSFERTPPSSQVFEPIKFRISQENITAPDSLNFVRIDSAPEVEIVAKMRVVQAKVVPNFENDNPAPGYSLDMESIQITPSEVAVAVTKQAFDRSRLAQLEIRTEPINIINQRENFRDLFFPVYDESRGMYPVPGSSRPQLEVLMDIPEIRVEKKFEDIPIRFSPLKRNIIARISPPALDVTLTGPVSLIGKISPENIVVNPFADRQLDAEVPGTSVEIALQFDLQIEDNLSVAEFDVVLEENSAIVRFEEIPTETPAILPENTTDEILTEPTPDLQNEISEAVGKIVEPDKLSEEDSPTTPSEEMELESEDDTTSEPISDSGKRTPSVYFDNERQSVLDTIYFAHGSGYPDPIDPSVEFAHQANYDRTRLH